MKFTNINIYDPVNNFLVDTSNMEWREPMFKQGDSYSYTWGGMNTFNGNEVDSKQDMVSVVLSPLLSEIGVDFVRDERTLFNLTTR